MGGGYIPRQSPNHTLSHKFNILSLGLRCSDRTTMNTVQIGSRKCLLSSPSVPHSLPLSSYTGTYHHAAYQNITVSLCNGTLVADLRHRASPVRLTFTHFSGESFLVQDRPTPSSHLGWASVAEFGVTHIRQVSEKNVAISLNVILEKALGKRAISFRRVSWWDEGADY